MLPVLTWIDKHTEEDDIENGWVVRLISIILRFLLEKREKVNGKLR